MCSHRVQFYDTDAFLIQTVLEFIEPAKRRGEGAIVIATPEHLAPLLALWDAIPGPARQEGADYWVFLDARETLARFMVDGMPDERRFLDVVGGVMRQVSTHGGRPVLAFGEMVALLYAEGQTDAAIRLEQLWEELARWHRFNLLCAYPLSYFPDAGHRQAFQCICSTHSEVNLIEGVSSAESLESLHRTIALLQQRANALEVELQRRSTAEREVDEQSARIATLTLAQAALVDLAGQDALTGLPNRRIFADRLAHAIERSTRSGMPVALIYLDLDGFKTLNDELGHDAGDLLLTHVAARLRTCARSVDTVCRWGGDEFAVIVDDADAGEAAKLMRRIVTTLGRIYLLGDSRVSISASAGLSLYPADGADAQALMRSADAAMYRAKRAANAHRTLAAQARGRRRAPVNRLAAFLRPPSERRSRVR